MPGDESGHLSTRIDVADADLLKLRCDWWSLFYVLFLDDDFIVRIPWLSAKCEGIPYK